MNSFEKHMTFLDDNNISIDTLETLVLLLMALKLEFRDMIDESET